MNKAEKKRLCRMLDCQKLSPEVRAHAVKNERLPLRTVVQVLFFEQERGSGKAINSKMLSQEQIPRGKQTPSDIGKLKLGPDEKFSIGEGTRKTGAYGMRSNGGKMAAEKSERKAVRREIEEVAEADHVEGREGREEGMSGSKLEAKKIMQKGNRSDHVRDKGRDR